MSKKSDADRAVTWLVGVFGNQSVDDITSNFARRRVATPVVFFAALAVIVDEINNHLHHNIHHRSTPWCSLLEKALEAIMVKLTPRAGASILDSVLIHSPHSQAPRVATLATMPMAALWLEHPIMPHSYFRELNSECLVMSPS